MNCWSPGELRAVDFNAEIAEGTEKRESRAGGTEDKADPSSPAYGGLLGMTDKRRALARPFESQGELKPCPPERQRKNSAGELQKQFLSG